MNLTDEYRVRVSRAIERFWTCIWENGPAFERELRLAELAFWRTLLHARENA